MRCDRGGAPLDIPPGARKWALQGGRQQQSGPSPRIQRATSSDVASTMVSWAIRKVTVAAMAACQAARSAVREFVCTGAASSLRTQERLKRSRSRLQGGSPRSPLRPVRHCRGGRCPHVHVRRRVRGGGPTLVSATRGEGANTPEATTTRASKPNMSSSLARCSAGEAESREARGVKPTIGNCRKFAVRSFAQLDANRHKGAILRWTTLGRVTNPANVTDGLVPVKRS